MCKSLTAKYCLAGILAVSSMVVSASAQNVGTDTTFGPVVRAYLGYLRNEQHVVDDRVSRREINQVYYRRNSNRIRALRQMAMQIADTTNNDYLPELEAVAADEFGMLFERPPRTRTLKVGEVLHTRFRYLGTVRSGEQFYVFARLDPYEQAELMGRSEPGMVASDPEIANPILRVKDVTRARRVSNPH